MGAAVTFADTPDAIQFIPKYSNSVLDTLFYADEELAIFRHDAFLEEAGLTQFDFDDDDSSIDQRPEQQIIISSCSAEKNLIKRRRTQQRERRGGAGRDASSSPRTSNNISRTSRNTQGTATISPRRREGGVVTAFQATPLFQARCQGYGRPADFLPLVPETSPLKGGTGGSYRIKKRCCL